MAKDKTDNTEEPLDGSSEPQEERSAWEQPATVATPDTNTVKVRCAGPCSVRNGPYSQEFDKGEHTVTRNDYNRFLAKTGLFELIG